MENRVDEHHGDLFTREERFLQSLITGDSLGETLMLDAEEEDYQSALTIQQEQLQQLQQLRQQLQDIDGYFPAELNHTLEALLTSPSQLMTIEQSMNHSITEGGGSVNSDDWEYREHTFIARTEIPKDQSVQDKAIDATKTIQKSVKFSPFITVFGGTTDEENDSSEDDRMEEDIGEAHQDERKNKEVTSIFYSDARVILTPASSSVEDNEMDAATNGDPNYISVILPSEEKEECSMVSESSSSSSSLLASSYIHVVEKSHILQDLRLERDDNAIDSLRMTSSQQELPQPLTPQRKLHSDAEFSYKVHPTISVTEFEDQNDVKREAVIELAAEPTARNSFPRAFCQFILCFCQQRATSTTTEEELDAEANHHCSDKEVGSFKPRFSFSCRVGVASVVAVMLIGAVTTGILVGTDISDTKSSESSAGSEIVVAPEPALSPACSKESTIKRGRVDFILKNVIIEDLEAHHVDLGTVLESAYNNASGMCNGTYERVLQTGEIRMVIYDYLATWETRVSCSGCPDDEPLFSTSVDEERNDGNLELRQQEMTSEFVQRFLDLANPQVTQLFDHDGAEIVYLETKSMTSNDSYEVFNNLAPEIRTLEPSPAPTPAFTLVPLSTAPDGGF